MTAGPLATPPTPPVPRGTRQGTVAPQPQASGLRPAPDVVPTAANGFGMVRSVMAKGNGRATVTHSSFDQKSFDLLGSKLRRDTSSMSSVGREQHGQAINELTTALVQRHTMTPAAVQATARDVHADVRSQMKGLNDGDDVTLKDNVLGQDGTGPDFAMDKPSAATGLRPGDTTTPEFKNWFGKSSIVNPDGSPRVVYHGTHAPDVFTSFQRNRSDIGIHFGTPEQANDRIKFTEPSAVPGAKTRILPVYLRIENPLRLKDNWDWKPDSMRLGLKESGKFTDDEINAATNSAPDPRSQLVAFRKLIRVMV